ncbi:hypothetical protein SISNIDRAFT_542418 [Sistotremastrum niveocremeum HHB9708]|uniref:Isomerase YbhE n=1 Tax=Sistotremastrum niveocremeum HHB9708 TaxID=1314777 RepID=A0A164X2P4_9AGAM|nr:hypothetical protein SISNIDRAFT_542418 [Sistotremastrum niveocremeum HHB9708]
MINPSTVLAVYLLTVCGCLAATVAPERAPAGTLYFSTNGAAANNLIAYDINTDGTLGAHGIDAPAPTSPDALFSQGSVQVSGKHVFATNPGSNTVAMFAINPANSSALSLVGSPMSSGGQFPNAIAVSQQTGHVCVANGGAVNGIQCFTADNTLGLRPISNSFRSLRLNLTTPPVGPAGTVSGVLFSEDGSKLFASVKGYPPTPGFIATWDVSTKGELSSNFTTSTPAAGGLLPFSMTLIPGKNALLNTDPGIGFSIFDFAKGDVASSSAYPIAKQQATCWSTYSQKTGTFFLTDAGTSTVTEVKVNNNLGASILKQYPLAAGSFTLDVSVATINGKDFLYVLQANSTSISVMSLKGPGRATPVQTYDFARDCENAGISLDSNNIQGMSVFVS